jgi:sugar phosphate isomerase/epimerase
VIIGTNFPHRAEYADDLQAKVESGQNPAHAMRDVELGYVELALKKNRLSREALQADIDFYQAAGLALFFHPYYECQGFGTTDENKALRPNLSLVLELAHTVGIAQNLPPTLNFHAASGRARHGREAMLEESIAFFSWLMAEVDRQGAEVVITVEFSLPRQGGWLHLCDNFDELRAVLAAIPHPRFGWCWDMGHSTMRYLMFNEAFPLPDTALLTRLRHVHIHDVDFRLAKDHRRIGTGQAPLGQYLALIQNAGYQGGLTMEYDVQEFFDEAYVDFLMASHSELMSLLVQTL